MRFRAVFPVLLLLLASLSLSTWGYLEPLAYTKSQSRTTLELIDALGSKHYLKQELNDSVSHELLDKYLESLDPSHSYFLSGDIRKLSVWQNKLDDTLKRGELAPAFDIFNQFREKALARLEKNIALLQSDYQFDFSVDETLVIDPDNKTWLDTEEQLDEHWRKLVKDSYLRLLLNDKNPDEIRRNLIRRYSNQIKQLKSRDAEDVYQIYMNALTGIYDPHTSYLSPRQLENFNISMSLSLEGIGAVLQSEDGYTKVVRVVPGGPADKHGALAPEDQIVGVGQGESGDIEDIIGWRLDDVVELIRGKKGTTVRLEIIPALAESQDETKILAIVRDKVKLEEQAAKSKILETDRNGTKYRIGVIDIPAFYLDFDAYRNRDPDFKSTTRDVTLLVDQLKEADVDGIIIDLRNNGGGSLQEATTLTDLFINPGPVVQIRHTNQLISRQYRSRSPAIYDGPVLVLINRLSASASEIFAGALQDYGRALVVGTQSYGKGTVQVLVPLSEGQVKLTESKFYRVSGESTQHRGVVPDISLPTFYSLEDIGESSQEHALPWDTIHPVPFKSYDDPRTMVPELQARHDQRVAIDPDFTYLQQELALIESRRKITEISLNAKTREAEKQQNESELMVLENKRRLAKGIEPFAAIAEWKADREEQARREPEKDDDGLELVNKEDILLREAGNILVDQVYLSSLPKSQYVQQQ